MQRVFEKIVKYLEIRSTENRAEGTTYGKVAADAIDMCIDVIKSFVKEYNNGWIPVSSGIFPTVPEGKEYVDVLITKQYTAKAEVVCTEYYADDGFNDYEKSLITAWRYDNFPEPYKAESEE